MAGTNRMFEAFSSRTLPRSNRACSRPTRRWRYALLAHNQRFHCSLLTMGFVEPAKIPLRRLLANFARDKSGVTAVEYALIAALIAVAAIAAFTLVGTKLSTTFSTIAAKL